MLSPRLTNCAECSNISVLLADIDCKLFELSKNLYNNVVFMLNLPIQGTVMNDLLNYKRILTYKLCNEDYAMPFTVEMIASRVKLLTYGMSNCCKKNVSNTPSTTTSTTTSSPVTTTTTSSSTTVLPPVIVPICLTYAAVGGCAASCGLDCSTYYTSSTCANYINTNAAPQPLGCVLYTDPAGTITAPNGWYSRPGGLCYILGLGNGEITGITNCP